MNIVEWLWTRRQTKGSLVMFGAIVGDLKRSPALAELG